MEVMVSLLIAFSGVIVAIVALLRGRVYLGIGASIVFALLFSVCGVALGHSFGIDLLIGIAAITAVQASYVALSLALEFFAAENLVSEVQQAIGRQLRSDLKPPHDLSDAERTFGNLSKAIRSFVQALSGMRATLIDTRSASRLNSIRGRFAGPSSSRGISPGRQPSVGWGFSASKIGFFQHQTNEARRERQERDEARRKME
jgi:hypothetical protein